MGKSIACMQISKLFEQLCQRIDPVVFLFPESTVMVYQKIRREYDLRGADSIIAQGVALADVIKRTAPWDYINPDLIPIIDQLRACARAAA